MQHTQGNSEINEKQREALVSMTAMYFIEENALLPHDKLEEAKNSLQALFLRTSGEETLLRKLIDILKITRTLHQSFSAISGIVSGTAKCVMTLERKIGALRQTLKDHKVTAEENRDFVGPFQSFSQEFQQKTEAYAKDIQRYLDLKEKEARYTGMFEIALAARERLRQRLSGELASETQGEIENKIKQEIISSFDYGETEANLKHARRDSYKKAKEIHEHLDDIKAMCQMAMNPNMRDSEKDAETGKRYEDIFVRFASSLRKHPRLLQIKDAVLELFKLYQHTFGMFGLDFNNLNRAIETMMHNTDAYFVAKVEDRDILDKREKLRKIEGVITFLEHTALLLHNDKTTNYNKFSKQLSGIISGGKTRWSHIMEDLLRAKVEAEAVLSTRL
jgi:uncharacterized protein YgfB (UPF0149 family)